MVIHYFYNVLCIPTHAHVCVFGVHMIMYKILVHCFLYMQIHLLFYLIAIPHAPRLHLFAVCTCTCTGMHTNHPRHQKCHCYLRSTHMHSHTHRLCTFYASGSCGGLTIMNIPHVHTSYLLCIGLAYTISIYYPLYKSRAHAYLTARAHLLALTRQGHLCLFGVHVIVYKMLVYCFLYVQMCSWLYSMAILHAPLLYIHLFVVCTCMCIHMRTNHQRHQKCHCYLRSTRMHSHAQTLHLLCIWKLQWVNHNEHPLCANTNHYA